MAAKRAGLATPETFQKGAAIEVNMVLLPSLVGWAKPARWSSTASRAGGWSNLDLGQRIRTSPLQLRRVRSPVKLAIRTHEVPWYSVQIRTSSRTRCQ